MSKIQVDMFEVQLGSALLVQFRAGQHVIRVLADAGVTASGYAVEHVHAKLPGILDAFELGAKRIDLIIGTHYDADHLSGLVPIIEDKSIEIGEAWMPPVANDTEAHAANDSVQERHMLGYQFAEEDGDERLFAYLNAKRAVCEEMADLEKLGEDIDTDRAHPKRESFSRRQAQPRESNQWEGNIDGAVGYFLGHIHDTSATIDASGYDHADDDIWGPNGIEDLDEKLLDSLRWRRYAYLSDALDTRSARSKALAEFWTQHSTMALAHVKSLAYVRRSAAKDAINATSLAKVVKALRKRRIPISYMMILDGTPRRFVWRAKARRFEPGSKLVSDGPELLLLGPSEGLIKKHWDRLPVGDYVAGLAFARIPIKGITPSNQLSYVTRLEFKEQGILVTGDAGFVDFKPTRGEYYTALLTRLLPLHVIQVAHHGGNNAHFYRVLIEAKYAEQTAPSFLLLSHAADDKYRPTKEFGMFIEQVRREGDDMKLLFTSRPSLSKVRDYQELIYPVIGTSADVGDIRLEFDGVTWGVKSHAVKV